MQFPIFAQATLTLFVFTSSAVAKPPVQPRTGSLTSTVTSRFRVLENKPGETRSDIHSLTTSAESCHRSRSTVSSAQTAVYAVFQTLKGDPKFALFPRCIGIVDGWRKLFRGYSIQESFQTMATSLGNDVYEIKLVRRWKSPPDKPTRFLKPEPNVFTHIPWAETDLNNPPVIWIYHVEANGIIQYKGQIGDVYDPTGDRLD